MVFFTYVDRPGIIGRVGTLLGEHDVNIATMDVGRKAEGGDALMCLTVDTEVPSEVLERVAGEIEAHQLRTVTDRLSGRAVRVWYRAEIMKRMFLTIGVLAGASAPSGPRTER